MKESVVFYWPPGKEYEGLEKIWRKAKVGERIEKGDTVCIKMHFGELGNTRYIRPILARKIVDLVKEAGGSPFLCDTTTLYRHKRSVLFFPIFGKNQKIQTQTLGYPNIFWGG